MKELNSNLYKYWGKAKPDASSLASYHLLPYHCLDVAAVGYQLLQFNFRLRTQFSRSFAIGEHLIQNWLCFFLAIHDLGKFSEAFQQLNLLAFTLLRQRAPQARYKYNVRHDSLGFLYWNDSLLDQIQTENWFGVQGEREEWDYILRAWSSAVTGHHGKPPVGYNKNGSRLSLEQYFSPDDCQAAYIFAQFSRSLFLKDSSIVADPNLLYPACLKASWLLAGFAILCDWLGSNQAFFKYYQDPMPLEEYWSYVALPQASLALKDAGVFPSAVNPTVGIKSLFPALPKSTALQCFASECKLAKIPQLFIFEDVTGSGKTEAALVLVHRMMAGGLADGLYIALPTMATANAMYARLVASYQHLYNEGETPSLVLAHAQAKLSSAFRESVMSQSDLDANYGDDEETATVQCRAWIADHRKRALLADIGVGTIDQALLGILPSKHQALRLFGLARKVLIVDEVHAYDAYVHKLLKTLLEFHSAAGGSAILLSATLPKYMRQELIDTYRTEEERKFTIQSDDYPLATHVHPFSEKQPSLEETALTRENRTNRNVTVEFIHDSSVIYDHIVKKAEEGQCVCWVRNTVQDAIEAYQALGTRIKKEKLILFHARYAMGDRLDIEKRVLNIFGEKSSSAERRGCVLVATQVIEQSLDIDFDSMISDLAPIDLLIQRAGRLHRHARNRLGERIGAADERGVATIYIYGPQWQAFPSHEWYSTCFPQGAYVYPDHAKLWLTVKLLQQQGGWSLPEDARALIEGVYGNVEIPKGLERRQSKAIGEAKSKEGIAALNVLNLAAGYEATVDAWLDDTKTPTRLGETTTMVRLVRYSENGIMLPWRDDGLFAWEMSQVMVSDRIISKIIETNDVQQLKMTMPDKGKWSVVLPLEQVDDNLWQGTAINKDGDEMRISYSREMGLSSIEKGRYDGI